MEKRPGPEKTEALLSGLKLTRARTWLAEKPLQLNEAERKFIQASVTHHEQELSTQRKRSRRRVRPADGVRFSGAHCSFGDVDSRLAKLQSLGGDG